jgi:hypothetical protein
VFVIILEKISFRGNWLIFVDLIIMKEVLLEGNWLILLGEIRKKIVVPYDLGCLCEV